MIPRADITGTRPLTRVEAIAPANSAGDARQEEFSRFTQIALGKQLQATVLSQLNDGTYLVRVAETPARMALPAGTMAGDRLDLTLISREPRPTFLLGQQADMGNSSATTSLSAAGRLIGDLLQNSQQGTAATLIGKTALLPAPAMNAPQVAAALHGALAFSGLFYESHVAQWAGGKRSLADLLREPQTKNSAAGLASRLERSGNEGAALLRAGPESAMRIEPELAKPGMDQTASPVSADAARLIGMQLDVLEQRRVLWQGELWPGQPLEWDVSEETPQQEHEEGARTWQSNVRFTLPTLGTVAATIRLVDGNVQVQLRAASETTAAALRTNGDTLAGALEAAGSSLVQLTVKQDGAV